MIRKAALLTLLTALLAPAGMAGSAAAASPHAAVAAAPAQADPLVVEQITPEIQREAATPIAVSGTVTGTPQSSVRVRIHYSPSRPFGTRAELASFLGDQGYLTTSYRTMIQVTRLDESGKLPFEFSVTPRELGMFRAGVYPLAIEVLDAVTGQRIAIDRTVLPYVPADTEQLSRVRLALAMPIVDRPHRADDSTFMDDDLRGSISSGRLANLLKLVQTTHETVTWFVDPALLQDVKTTSAGPYMIKKGDGARRSAADPAAGKWLSDLRAALSGKPVLAMPFGDPDLAALVHNRLDAPAVAAVQRGASAASELLGREVPTSTTWPVGGRIDRDTLDELAMSGVKSVLLSGNAFLPALPDDSGTTQTGTTQTAPSNVPSATTDAALRVDTVAETPVTALLADPTLSEILSSDVSAPGNAMLARQRFIGETAMIAFEQTGQTGQGGQTGQTAEQRTQPIRTIVAAPEDRVWNPDPAFVSSLMEAVADAPWLRMTSLDSVKPTRAARSDFSYTDQDRQAELRRAYLGTVRRLGQEADAVSTVTTKHNQLFHEAILRLTSAAWRNDRKRAHAFAKQVEGAINDRLRKVSVIDTPRAVAGTDGQVPVSVANNLDRNITIKIRVTSDDEARLAIPDGAYETDPITVLSDRTQLVNVPVTVPKGGGGEATISVQVLTAEGGKYGKAVHVTVRATDYTGIAVVIVGGALVIMLAAVVLRILRRRSRRNFPFDPQEGDGPAASNEAPSDAAPPGRAEPGQARAASVEVERGDQPPA